MEGKIYSALLWGGDEVWLSGRISQVRKAQVGSCRVESLSGTVGRKNSTYRGVDQ